MDRGGTQMENVYESEGEILDNSVWKNALQKEKAHL